MTWSSHAAAILVLAGVAAAAGCTGDDSDTGSTLDATDGAAGSPATVPTTTSPRSTPFCVGMIELAERLDEAGPDADTAAIIRTAYADLTDVVPPEIRADFDAVRRLLVAEGAPSTADSDGDAEAASDASDATAAAGDGEGTSLADTPSERVADYVDLMCRGTANNPGPAETQPAAAPATTAG